ncbi:MAG: hypothetical protein RL425_1356 [Pseudomonadota bacterium]
MRSLRKAAGRTQEDLAYSVDIDVRYLGGIERGQENPSLKILIAISEALGVNIKDLFDGL